MSESVTSLKTGWWSIELPEYREHPEGGTYSLFAYEELPPIPISLDDDFQWLKAEPTKDDSLKEAPYINGIKPDLTKLSSIIEQIKISLPKSFTTFIDSPDLQSKIRSSTDCYLDVADRAVKTVGDKKGFLVHFLSDSQWCLHWYIHVNEAGKHFVIVSPNAYGFIVDDIDDELEYICRTDEIELEKEELWYCAPTFTEFIYRFWIENEIWFALSWDEEPLTAIQHAYVNHYLSDDQIGKWETRG